MTEFSIYQINVDRDTANVCFIGMESLEKIKGTKEVNAAAYDRVYDGKMDCISLENIYQKFNVDHPADYKGRSLSVSDVVEIRESDTLNPGFYFVDSMLDTAPIDVSTVEELPSPNMGAFYKNEDQTLYIKRDIGDSVALCQCVAQELGHAQLAMNCEAYSRRDMGFSAVCVGYMLCRKFGVDVKNFAIDRIPEELAGKSPKEIRAELSKTRSAMSEIGSRVSEEIYRRRAERSKEQER